MLSLGQLYTDDNNDANDNDTRWTNHDCIGSLACMPNEPKKTSNVVFRIVFMINAVTFHHDTYLCEADSLLF